MKKFLLTGCFALSTLFVSAQFMVMTTVNAPDADAEPQEEWGLESFTDRLGIGYQVADNFAIGGARNGEEDFQVWARYLHNENLFISMFAPTSAFSDEMQLGLGYSFNAWESLFIEPSFSLPVQKDPETDKRDGVFNFGLAWKLDM
ncbi:MAG: hypothetical protein VX347_00565 [Bacteroidota bacterium]|nr:hypothetical protein [Bacteroidota bacterium]